MLVEPLVLPAGEESRALKYQPPGLTSAGAAPPAGSALTGHRPSLGISEVGSNQDSGESSANISPTWQDPEGLGPAEFTQLTSDGSHICTCLLDRLSTFNHQIILPPD